MESTFASDENIPEAFVHLAFLDESGIGGYSSLAMFGAIIVSPGIFGHLENLHAAAIQQILGLDEIDERFQEFKGSELYHGEGPFEGIDESKRLTAIRTLLTAVQVEHLPFIYAAVDRKKFRDSQVAQSSMFKPLDFAFQYCLLGVEDWATANHPDWSDGQAKIINFKDSCLFIADDYKSQNSQQKEAMRRIYRNLRPKRPFINAHNCRLWHAHDEMYFGDSKESVGIQIADLCCYFMWRHLEGKPEPQNFYGMFANQAMHAQPKPEWSSYSGLFRQHTHVANSKNETAGEVC